MYHHTVELTVSIEVRCVKASVVTLQRGKHCRRRNACLLTLGHVDVNHVLRITRVVRSHGHLDFRTLVEFAKILLYYAEELVEVSTGTVEHNERNTVVGRESRNHRRSERQNLGILN